MSELARIPLANPEMLVRIAAENKAYAGLVEAALSELERRLARGEFRAWREVRHVLWFYGHEGGVQPGGFVHHLLTVIDVADMDDRRRLGLGFQAYVVMVEILKLVPDGAVRLRKLVDDESC